MDITSRSTRSRNDGSVATCFDVREERLKDVDDHRLDIVVLVGVVRGVEAISAEIGKDEAVTLDDLSRSHVDGLREARRVRDERMELAVLTAWIHRRR